MLAEEKGRFSYEVRCMHVNLLIISERAVKRSMEEF